MKFEVRGYEFESCLLHLLAALSWTSHLNRASFFFTCKMMKISPTEQGYWTDYMKLVHGST